MHISVVKALRRPVGHYLTGFQSVIPKLIGLQAFYLFLAEHMLMDPLLSI